MSTGDKIRKNVKLNKPAAEVVWKLPPTAEQTQCCQSQRSDCGDVVSQARPDLNRICITMQDDQSVTSDEFSSNVASDRECDNLLEDVFKLSPIPFPSSLDISGRSSRPAPTPSGKTSWVFAAPPPA